MSTIYALASAPGRAGVSVIRVSGPKAHDVGSEITGAILPSHGRSLRKLFSADGDVIDEALVLTFDEGKSFTGERVVEFQVHGSIAVINALLNRLAAFAGLILAEPGEFTRRALLNNRLDLAQVEGLADLIDAETEAQRKQALSVFSGAVGEKVAGWRQHLLHASALVTALIDFADEDLPESFTDEILASLQDLADELETSLRGYASAERIRSGYEVAIVGRPNAGKSTLLNYLAGREAAITSEYAGTTRDVIEVRMDLDGLPVTLLDTAGLREDAQEIEAIGIERAKARAASADFVVYLQEDEADQPDTDLRVDITVQGKADLEKRADGVSGLTGQGVAEFTKELVDHLKTRSQNAGVIVRQRHKTAVENALDHIRVVMTGLQAGNVPEEILAEELRRASVELASIVGDIDVEDVLGEIFSSFCIGK